MLFFVCFCLSKCSIFTHLITNYHHISWCSLPAIVYWNDIPVDAENSHWVQVRSLKCQDYFNQVFYTFVTLEWLCLISTPQKSMNNVHNGMHNSDTVLNFGNILLLKTGGKHNWHCEEFSQINNSAISPPQKQTVKLYWTGVSVWIVKGSSHCISYTHTSIYI